NEQLGQRRLSRAAAANDRDQLTRLDVQTDVLQNIRGVLAAVTEVDALETNVTLQLGNHHARGQILGLLLGLQIEHVAEALHRHRSIVQQAPEPYQAHQRRQHAAHQGIEGDELSDGQLTRQYQAGTSPQHGDRGSGVEHLSNPADHDVEPRRAELNLQRLRVLRLPLQ